MFPLQTLSDPTMAIVVLCIVSIFVVLFGFIWAFGKISEGPGSASASDADADSGRGRGV
jgi:hypothetical protein